MNIQFLYGSSNVVYSEALIKKCEKTFKYIFQSMLCMILNKKCPEIFRIIVFSAYFL